MTDPTFTTRAQLSRWMATLLTDANKATPGQQLELLQTARRVTLAHSHLPWETEL